MTFIPEDMDKKEAIVPWFEDSSAELGLKGHSTKKSIDDLKMEIRSAMARLGGGVTMFVYGNHQTSPPRVGYQILFSYGRREGKIEIAALPLKNYTEGKLKQSKKQALYTVREMLEAEFNAGLLVPGSAPLVPFLLNDSGQTFAETLAQSEGVPLLSPPLEKVDEIIEGEFVEEE